MTAALVDHDAAMDSLATVEGWLYLATRALSEPAFAAVFVPLADPMYAVAKLGEAVTAVEALRLAFRKDKVA